MRRWAAVLSALAITCTAATAVAGTASAGNDNDPYTLSDGHAAGPMSGIVPARDASHGPRSSVSLLNYHGGVLMTSGSAVQPIFWGTRWNDSTFTGDKITGIDDFYRGVGGSAYMGTNTEYTDSAGAFVSPDVSASAAVKDTSAAPTKAPSTTTILNEVAKLYPTPTPGTYFPVYVDTPRGHTGYCAWHSYGTINGRDVTIGFFFNLDGDGGCDPQNTSTKDSQGLEALANVTGHELSEMVTDPRNGGYWDSSGAENADKCAWTFGGTSNFGGHDWKIQGNWSNAAALAHSGYDKSGCIYQ